MAIKPDKKVVAITLPKFYLDKLEVMCTRLGISKSEMLRRLIDEYRLFLGETKSPG
jgi:metal-responsive CopG/Arc/MetJ family transcriptional regulator